MPDSKDFSTMQEEAIRRVREMQRRSREIVEPPPSPPPPPKPEKAETADTNKKSDPLFSIAGINIDEEKALIAFLIYILYKNNADTKLMMALAYLLL